jgi:DNA-binding GntR family transcriptional regulator
MSLRSIISSCERSKIENIDGLNVGQVGCRLVKMSAHPRENSKFGRDLRKHEIAEVLLAEIVGGTLAPGEQISERTWATRFGVAQASIREAINILAHDGFVTKESGRSARVVNLSEEDVVQLYQVRAGLEGMAGYLAASIGADVSNLQSIVQEMRRASEARDSKALTDWDLQFHLELCRISGNSHLHHYAQKILQPFFAFVRMRVSVSGQGTSAWGQDVDVHQHIVDLIQEGEADLAEHYVKKSMARFASTARKNWILPDKRSEGQAPAATGRRRRNVSSDKTDESS